jgi:DNA invertase Pin-like site-specific DNA recombinase
MSGHMRTAVYARFSSDLQRETSLEDQIRVCQEYTDRHGWNWQSEHVYTDAAISGASIEGRPGLAALLTAAAQIPRPFDVLLVDDSSRVARDLADALRVVQHLTFAGVRVVYISQGVDSASEQHETLIAVHGLVDGLYLKEMAAKIKRGLKGQLARGFATGSRTFGYRSVLVPDAQRPNEAVGFRLEIDQGEAAAIRDIYTWYADGAVITDIITRLVRSGHPAPRGGSWRVGALRRLLRNPKYTGQLVWGRTQQARRPGSSARVLRSVPPDQWQTQTRPELRIVSDELWTRVQARIQDTDRRVNRRRQDRHALLLRGRDARLHGRALFSGFLHCGTCGHAIGIVGSHTVNGITYRYYGCAHASRNGDTACTNRLTVRDTVANAALLAGLQAELTRPETIDAISAQLTTAVNDVLHQRPAQRAELLRAREAAAGKLANLVAAVEAGSTSPTLLSALSAREAELAVIDAKVRALDEPIDERISVIPTWVRQQLEDAAGLAAEAPDRARLEFDRLGISITLQPVYDEGARPFLRAVASGQFDQRVLGRNAPFPASDRLLQEARRRTADELFPVPLSPGSGR